MLNRRTSGRAGTGAAVSVPGMGHIAEERAMAPDRFPTVAHPSSVSHRQQLDRALKGPSRSFSRISIKSTSTTRTFRSVIPAPDPPPVPVPAILESRGELKSDANDDAQFDSLADELDYISVSPPSPTEYDRRISHSDKASRILGIKHRHSMEPLPAVSRASIVSTHSARDPPATPSHTPTTPLTSLYVVSGLPKAPHTWTLADPDSVLGLAHTDGAVNRWWRAEVLGSTVSPGAGGARKKKKSKNDTEYSKGAGALSKQEVGKMLSKALKLSFTREVEIIASTLQPASTVHTFSFNLPAPSTPLAPSASNTLLRASVVSATTSISDRPQSGVTTSLFPYNDPFSHARPSSAFLGPPTVFSPGNASKSAADPSQADSPSATVTYHGVCLTVWSHADAERSAAIRRTLEASRSRKESSQSLVAARLKNLRADTHRASDPSLQARRSAKKSARGPWGGGAGTDVDTDVDGETDGAMSESDMDVASTYNHNPGESTLFLPGDTVFWLPYALTLVSRHPIYDLMRDYLTLSWARFSKDVQSHTLQISKILAHPAPRAGDLVKLDASATSSSSSSNGGVDTSLEVIARFPGGLDFGRGLVDINFTMWPLFKALNIDNILTICEIALTPTGRILFYSRHPAMLGIAVSTIKYLVELRGWNGVALQAVHSRDAKIYVEDPGPWIIGLSTEARYSARPSSEVCVCDLDINYLNCASPPPGAVSVKQQRERYRQRLLQAFEPHYHPDHSVPSEFKEAFPAGRFRPVCKIQAKRGGSSAAVADIIKPPEWWHSTRIIQAFDAVLQDKMKKPSFLKRISSFGTPRRAPQLTVAEQHIQYSIRKRAMAFVDARDDLETKIGRLSRRLNFLMTESDLWRDKFVTFEQYAEKLSVEANELRSKINKEQRESKRLSGLISMTAAEKAKLQNQLKDTEYAHREAQEELTRMREAMETMEQERAEMVAEVEAQIEKALASMAVDVDSDDYDSRPGSRVSSRPASRPGSRVSSRRPSDAGGRNKQLRSFPTESTLTGSYEGMMKEEGVQDKLDLAKAVIEEGEESEEPMSPSQKKRFSASNMETGPDGMGAVDEGISERSDRIAQKVLQIQQKLESALASDGETRWKNTRYNGDSESEMSERQIATTRPRPPRGTKLVGKPPPRAKTRKRSDTSSSKGHTSATERPDTSDTTNVHQSRMPLIEDDNLPEIPSRSSLSDVRTPTRGAFITSREIPDEQSTSERERASPPRPARLRKIASDASVSATSPTTTASSAITPTTPALTPAITGTTDDSDTDFQSAYSTSPRNSYSRVDDKTLMDAEEEGRFEDDATHMPTFDSYKGRPRVESVVTVGPSRPSPTFSDSTVVSPMRQTRRMAVGDA
ncbi:AEX-3 domain-containing protein [Amylostereum chailletii]|nr:AEX-3 domain-containing protein [Amylostereum chailletii]